MRTHKLLDLTKSKYVKSSIDIPDFDFYNINEVKKFSITFQGFNDVDDEGAVLEIEAMYGRHEERQLIKIIFIGVTGLVLPDFQSRFFITELEIEDVRNHGHENVNLEAVDHFDRSFVCRCRRLEIISASR